MKVYFTGYVYIYRNIEISGDGLMYLKNVFLNVKGELTAIFNEVDILISFHSSHILFNGLVTLYYNLAKEAMVIYKCDVVFNGSSIIANNTASIMQPTTGQLA